MKAAFRLVKALLLVCLLSPQPVQAGGDMGKNPYEIGEKHFARKNYKIALTHYRKALLLNDVRAHYRMGLIFEDAGKDRDALNHYRRFVELGQPDDQRSDAVRRVGPLEERLKKKPKRSLTPTPKPGAKLKPAPVPGPKPTLKLLEQGKSLFKKGDYQEAEQVLLQAIANHESLPEAHFYLGEVYMHLEAYGKAESEYKKAKGYY